MVQNPSMPAPLSPRSAFTMAVSLLGCAGLPAIFLSFTSDVSPFMAIPSTYFPLAVPLVLSVVIAAVTAAWMVSGTLAGRARAIAHGAAWIAAASFAWLAVRPHLGGWFELNIREAPVWMWVPPLAVVVAGPLVARWIARQPDARDAAALVAMELVYVGASALSLIAFWDDYDPGAYFVAVAAAAYLVQVIAMAVAARRIRR